MTKIAVLFALSLALASCATPSASPPPAVEQPKAKAPDPRICAEVAPAADLPAGASLPQAVTPEERQGLALLLGWVAELVDHDKVMTDRADLARREVCKPR